MPKMLDNIFLSLTFQICLDQERSGITQKLEETFNSDMLLLKSNSLYCLKIQFHPFLSISILILNTQVYDSAKAMHISSKINR